MNRIAMLTMVFAGLLLVLGESPLLAQTTTGRITGTVTDDSGAVIPGAEVTVRNPGTGLTRSVVTNESGTYQLPFLPSRVYELEAALPGFRSEVRSGVTRQVNAVLRIDFKVRLGDLQDKIQPIADAPLVQAETATLGQVTDSRKITDIPLNQTNFMKLTLLSTGVQPDAQGGDRQSPSFYANGTISAPPGYPTVIVPFGMVPNAPTPPLPEGFNAKPTPYGVSFTGLACSEPKLLELSYGFEQATKRRISPPQFP